MEFLLIASAHFMALLSPGPDFFLILQTALRMPLRYAFAVCVGITTANGAYLIVAVTGLEAVKEMTTLMLILKYLGGAYLLYIGIMLLRAPLRSLENKSEKNVLHVKSMRRQFAMGFMSAILNPKNAIFYLSLFTVMVSSDTTLVVRALYGLWMTAMVLIWDLGIAGLLGNRQIKKWLGRWIFGIEKISGAMLALFGVLLTFQ
jgi:threonine efflux protein